MNKIRVRFPPSPTGIPHIGNMRTALFNYVFAKHHGGKFIVRIEDTDQKRIVPGAKEAIFESLEWLGLVPDEAYTQSERLALYKKKAVELVDKGFARLDEGAIRFIVPKGQEVSWVDAIGDKKITFQTDDIEDFIILKSDEFPTYHLANVVDDHEMTISHVMRGDEWIASTPKHILLYNAFSWPLPIFAHLPVILGTDRTKLSKRHGAEALLEYRNRGYLPEAIINFLMLLGWTHPEQKELFTIEEATKYFDLPGVHTNAPIFDSKKLEWMNGYYIRQLTNDELNSKLETQNSKLKLDKKQLHHIVALAQTRMKTLADFNELVTPWFESIRWELSEEEKSLAKKVHEAFLPIAPWKSELILKVLQKVLADEHVSMKTLYQLFTGEEQGLPISDMLEITGKEKTLDRLKEAIK